VSGMALQGRFVMWITLLVAASLVCVGLVVYGEIFDRRLLGAGAMGVLLILYSFIVLLFRKAGWQAGEE
jgi:hypothetical protein